eukprot:scaffold2554_cov321-Prasinococcus_capsulatus_cf.AAC.7
MRGATLPSTPSLPQTLPLGPWIHRAQAPSSTGESTAHEAQNGQASATLHGRGGGALNTQASAGETYVARKGCGERSLHHVLQRARDVHLGDLRHAVVNFDKVVHALHELRVLHIQHLREDARCGAVGLEDNVAIELAGIQADGVVEGGALVVVHVHGHVHAQAEEA